MVYLLEEITGKSSAENVRERILQPLGMTHSEPLFTHDTYARLATGYTPLYDDRPNHSSLPLIEATWLEYDAGDDAIVETPSDMADISECCSIPGAHRLVAVSKRRY